MKMHKRFLCLECKREWLDPRESNNTGGNYVNSWPVSITGNPPGENCPICGSPEIQEIIFKPFMEGLDIPRDGEYTVLPKKRTTITIPGRTGADALLIRADADPNPHKMVVTRQDVINPVNTPLALKASIPVNSDVNSEQDNSKKDSEFDALELFKGMKRAGP